MSCINKIYVMGRLTKDPELRELEDGTKVANITLAVDRNYKAKDGNKITDFLRFSLWNKNAENICKLSRKGLLVCLEGYNTTKEIENKDGIKIPVIQPVIEKFSALEKGNKQELENDAIEEEEKELEK